MHFFCQCNAFSLSVKCIFSVSKKHWRVLQSGRIYICQLLEAAKLSVDDLRDLISHEGEDFSNRELHFTTTLRGTW